MLWARVAKKAFAGALSGRVLVSLAIESVVARIGPSVLKAYASRRVRSVSRARRMWAACRGFVLGFVGHSRASVCLVNLQWNVAMDGVPKGGAAQESPRA